MPNTSTKYNYNKNEEVSCMTSNVLYMDRNNRERITAFPTYSVIFYACNQFDVNVCCLFVE